MCVMLSLEVLTDAGLKAWGQYLFVSFCILFFIEDKKIVKVANENEKVKNTKPNDTHKQQHMSSYGWNCDFNSAHRLLSGLIAAVKTQWLPQS